MKKFYLVLISLVLAATAALCVFAASFNDVEDGDYYADAAERMAHRGILSGYGDGYFYGGESVTRAQIAALVCKMLGKTTEAAALAGKTAFADVNEDAWYTGYINYAVANGIILGDGDGNFRPDDFVKYEEVVKVVVCVLGLDKNVKIDPSDWSKEYIEAAENANLVQKLIGVKGTPMLRSDIAVICDAAMVVLDKAEESEVLTTTTKKNAGTTKPKPKPEQTTTTTTKNIFDVSIEANDNELPILPIG